MSREICLTLCSYKEIFTATEHPDSGKKGIQKLYIKIHYIMFLCLQTLLSKGCSENIALVPDLNKTELNFLRLSHITQSV